MIFCQIFRDSPVVNSSTSLTAARATGSSNFCTYSAEAVRKILKRNYCFVAKTSVAVEHSKKSGRVIVTI